MSNYKRLYEIKYVVLTFIKLQLCPIKVNLNSILKYTDSMNVNRNNDSLVQNNNVFNPSNNKNFLYFFFLLINSIKQTFDI